MPSYLTIIICEHRAAAIVQTAIFYLKIRRFRTIIIYVMALYYFTYYMFFYIRVWPLLGHRGRRVGTFCRRRHSAHWMRHICILSASTRGEEKKNRKGFEKKVWYLRLYISRCRSAHAGLNNI